MACFAPRARASCVTALPTDPPIAGASTVLPALKPARMRAICAVRYATGIPAALTSSTLSGIKQRLSLRTASHSLSAPSSKTPYGPVNITREPTGRSAPPPSSTTPAPSLPRTSGAFASGKWPERSRLPGDGLSVPRSSRTQSERMHVVAGWSDLGDSIRQLRLRLGQRIEGLAQQLDLAVVCHQVSAEHLMERSPGRSGACVRHILGERLLRRVDEDVDVVRCEHEVWIEFPQPVKEPGDRATAGVPRLDSERAQERQFKHSVVRKKRSRAFRITNRGEIVQQQSFRVFHLHLLQEERPNEPRLAREPFRTSEPSTNWQSLPRPPTRPRSGRPLD